MKKLASFLIALSLCAPLAQAQQAVPLLGAGGAFHVTTGGVDPATTAWVNAVVTAGGTVSGTQQTNVNNLIVALKAHGSWTSIKRMWLYAGESISQQATIDIKSLSVGTISGSLSLNASGYSEGAGTDYFDTGYDAVSDSLNPDDVVFGAYATTNFTTGPTNPGLFGVCGASKCLYMEFFALVISYDVADFTFPNSNAYGGVYKGNYTIWSSDSTHQGMDKNEAAFGTAAKTSSGFNSGNLLVGNINNGGSIVTGSGDMKVGAFWFGTDNSKRTSVASDLNAYMTAWGVNAY